MSVPILIVNILSLKPWSDKILIGFLDHGFWATQKG